ncbi:hypothetical protein C9122_23840, partial [Escherichia coli]
YMSLKERYYKVSYCGRDSRFRLFPAQSRMCAANASCQRRMKSYPLISPPTAQYCIVRDTSISTSGIWRSSGC